MIKQITTEELAQANDINNRYNKVYLELGQNTIQTKDYQAALDVLRGEAQDLHQDYVHIQEEEVQLAEALSAKYGEGQLDLSTGVLTIA